MTIVLNDQQQAVVNHTLAALQSPGKSQIEVSALPGVGKTATVIEVAKAARNAGFTVGMSAFTNANADDIQDRIPDNGIKVQTSHKFGMQQFPFSFKISDSVVNLMLQSADVESRPEMERLVALAKAYMVNSRESLEMLISKFSIAVKTEEIGIAQNIIQAANAKSPNVNDLIYLPARNGWAKRTYDLYIVDEYQDQSVAQVELAQNIAARVLLVVGDPNQAIFGFRGGLYQPLDGARKLTMNLTYRFGQVIADYVNGMFGTNIIPALDKPGSIVEDSTLEYELMDSRDMIVARTNAELFRVALGLIAADRPMRFTNENLLERLIHLLLSNCHNQICPKCKSKMISRYNKKWGGSYFLGCSGWPKCKGSTAKIEFTATSIATLENIRSDIAVAKQAANANKIEEWNDIGLVMEILLAQHTPEQLYNILKSLGNSKEGVMLTTCHKAKGLEAENIHVLMAGFQKLYSRAKELDDLFQLEQERNLLFVAMTRPKSNLHLIGPAGMEFSL